MLSVIPLQAKPLKGKSSKPSAKQLTGPTRALESQKWSQGYKAVAGVDEAGRGPLAGPVVAAACIISQECDIPGINDSKAMTEDDREQLYTLLTSSPHVHWAV
jgi:ribonuclease HII